MLYTIFDANVFFIIIIIKYINKMLSKKKHT